ncbi:hypothetical protein [Marinoscillum sp.]|uniref:hypothetical protein n=1 Tax=Marinoscillum sp. TaxID=2024838 RepID=UPI003BAD2B49
MSLRLIHVLNPFDSQNTDQQRIQEVTFQSIANALDFGTGHMEVKVCAIRYSEDMSPLPKYMTELPNLSRSVLDFGDFNPKRRYPLVGDIMEEAVKLNGDYYMYTNMDIALQPSFYDFVSRQIRDGHDAVIINRRRIPWEYANKELPEMYALEGKKHPGFDCFVFSKAIADRLILGRICVGIPFIGVALAHNLFAFAERLAFYDRAQLTFHLGMEVMPHREPDYYWHNRLEFFNRVKPSLWLHFDVSRFPYGRDWLPLRLIRWGLNPSLFIWMNIKLLLRKAFLSDRS